MKKAIFLYDYTGIMAQPWVDAGYECWLFDGQHKNGIEVGDDSIIRVGMWFDAVGVEKDVQCIISMVGGGVEFVFGFPECTHLAVSGASHFARKLKEDPYIQIKATLLAKMVGLLGESLNAKWGVENPVSVLSTLWRKPDYKFDPYEYGGYLPEDDVHPIYPDYIAPRDAYPKKTCIWAGNGFIMPEKRPVSCPPRYSDQYKRLGGKSIKTKNIRSATPRGFAKAVFDANGELS